LVFDVNNFDVGKVFESIMGGGLFVSKKMIVIYGVPLDNNIDNKLSSVLVDGFINKFDKITVPENVILIFVSYRPDKRLKFYKSLKDRVDLKEFNPFRMTSQYKSLLSENLWNLTISSDLMEYFLLKVGKNLYRLSSELEKLKIWCDFNSLHTVDQKIIDFVVYGNVEVNAFEFFDYFWTDKKKVIEIWDRIHSDWTDFNQALWMLYWGLKMYILMLDCYNLWITDSKDIAQITWIHPFAISKNNKNQNYIITKSQHIKEFYNKILSLDFSVKTWSTETFEFWLEVKKIIVEMV